MSDLLRLDMRCTYGYAQCDRSFALIMQQIVTTGSDPLYHPSSMIYFLLSRDYIPD